MRASTLDHIIFHVLEDTNDLSRLGSIIPGFVGGQEHGESFLIVSVDHVGIGDL